MEFTQQDLEKQLDKCLTTKQLLENENEKLIQDLTDYSQMRDAFVQLLTKDWPPEIGHGILEVKWPEALDDIIYLKSLFHTLLELNSRKGLVRHNEEVLVYMIGRVLYRIFLRNHEVPIENKEHLLQNIQDYINSLTRYVSCENFGLSTAFVEKYHQPLDEMFVIRPGDTVQLAGFHIIDKITGELLYKASVK